jgi:hypothetical protein
MPDDSAGLVSWLEAQIAEDERIIAEIEDSDDDARESRGAEGLAWINPSNQWNDTWRLTIPASHVLAECATKRAIIERYRVCEQHHDAYSRFEARVLDWTLRQHAQTLADRPGYHQEWAPQ